MLNLITTIHTGASDNRLNEYFACLKENASNSLINKIVVIIEQTTVNNPNISKLPVHEKINVINHTLSGYRPTFSDIISYINTQGNGRWIICNSDIYFPRWNESQLKNLCKIDLQQNIVTLTRYNILESYTGKQKKQYPGYTFIHDNIEYITMHGGDSNEGTSVDSWIIETPIAESLSVDFCAGNRGTVFNEETMSYNMGTNSVCNLDIEIGRPWCDQMVNYELSKIRKLVNPCLNIVSIHKHNNWSEDSDVYNDIKHRGVTYTKDSYMEMMMWQREFRWKSVKFSTFKGHENK